jgi:tRNA(Ile)-lysidine synthase
MPPVRDLDGVRFVRPLLDTPRAYTRAAAATLTVPAWDDPHNHDPSFARARARTLLHTLAEGLGPAVVDNLARTAALVAADAAVLEDLATTSAAEVTDADGALDTARLAALPDAMRGRVLHRWARSLGCPGSALSHRHVKALDALVTAWHGQGPVALPGGVWVTRTDGRLRKTT